MDEAREEMTRLVEIVEVDQAMKPDLAVIIDETRESIDRLSGAPCRTPCLKAGKWSLCAPA